MHRTIALAAALFLLTAPAFAADRDWSPVAQALGKEGAVMMPGSVYRVSFPRTDLAVSLDGIAVKPSSALGGWVAFEAMADHAMMMGDLVFTEDEVAPVMEKLLASGIQVTALHNHLLRATPATMFMHVMAIGDPVRIATALHDAIAATPTPFTSAAPAPAAPPADLNIAALSRTIGATGRDNGGIVQFSIPRAETVSQAALPVPPAMGSAVAINMQPLGTGRAAITGDLVLTGREVEPVLTALVDNGIEVTALHSHMVEEMPRLYFMHFWATGNADQLATGLRAALDRADLARG